MFVKPDTTNLRTWHRTKARPHHVARAVREITAGVPREWTPAMQHLGAMRQDAPEWLAALEALESLEAFRKDHGNAGRWNMDDEEICALADRLAAEAQELDAVEQRQGAPLTQRMDTARMLARVAGVEAPRAILGEGVIKRLQDARWWRRALRVHVARVVEAGAIKLGIVNKRDGGYASGAAVRRRQHQQARNAAALGRALYRNEAGQVFTLAQLAALTTSNPAIRGGELMTRIRGAEEYADERGHLGLFLTLTCPSAMHRMTVGSGGRPHKNRRYDGTSTPRDGQAWLRKMWARTRAALGRAGVRFYGLRVAEPHHDGTPHWHACLWVEGEAQAQALEATIRAYWLSEAGGERGAAVNRVNVKRMEAGGAAGYCAKYISKNVGHHVLDSHQDAAQGHLFTVEQGDVPGHVRVEAWAAQWGIRQFQFLGMPPVTVWRELRRVTSDQADTARTRWADVGAWSAWSASGARTAAGVSGDACWRTYMRAMGGHCAGRGGWVMRLARRDEPGRVNQYGEAMPAGRVVGVECRGGQWLISRRMAWSRVAGEDSQAAAQDGAQRARQGTPWTGFNNCTARLGGKFRAAILGLRSARQCADGVESVDTGW